MFLTGKSRTGNNEMKFNADVIRDISGGIYSAGSSLGATLNLTIDMGRIYYVR